MAETTRTDSQLQSRQGDAVVQLVGGVLGPVEPHATGGWPEFTITLRYLVRTDDLDVGIRAAKDFFAGTDFRADSDEF